MVHPCFLTHADNSMSGLSGNILVFVFWNNKHFWSSSGNEIFQAFGLGKESWTLFIFAPSEAHPSYRRINWKINDCRHTKKHHIFLIKKSALSILAAAASKESTIEILSINMLNQKNIRRWWHALILSNTIFSIFMFNEVTAVKTDFSDHLPFTLANRYSKSS